MVVGNCSTCNSAESMIDKYYGLPIESEQNKNVWLVGFLLKSVKNAVGGRMGSGWYYGVVPKRLGGNCSMPGK